MHEMTEPEYHQLLDVNLKGVFLGMKHEFPTCWNTAAEPS